MNKIGDAKFRTEPAGDESTTSDRKWSCENSTNKINVDTNTHKSSHVNEGTMIGVAIGLLVLVIVIIGLTIVIWKRRVRKCQDETLKIICRKDKAHNLSKKQIEKFHLLMEDYAARKDENEQYSISEHLSESGFERFLLEYEELRNQQALPETFGYINTSRYSGEPLLKATYIMRDEPGFELSAENKPNTISNTILHTKLHMNEVGSCVAEPTFLCCSAPLMHEMDEFVKRLFIMNVKILICLISTRESQDTPTCKGRAYRYWDLPIKSYKEYTLETIEICSSSNTMDVVKFAVYRNKTKFKKTVHMIWYKAWGVFNSSDYVHSVKINKIIKGLQKQYHDVENGLILVHCSTGLGRTGTLVATLLCIEFIERYSFPINVYQIAKYLRSQRHKAIHNELQYLDVIAGVGEYMHRQKRGNEQLSKSVTSMRSVVVTHPTDARRPT